jgi:hypothetical protein
MAPSSGPRSPRPATARTIRPGPPDLGTETVAGRTRPVSWWRTVHDRVEPSLPRLVREADRRWRAQARADHLERVKERLAERYATEIMRTRLGLPVPPSGRPKRARPRRTASVAGRRLADYPDLLAEWAGDVNAGLDLATLPAGSRGRVAWRCVLEPAHVWETRVSDRAYHGSGCQFHMGIRVRPAESLAASIRGWPPSGIPSATCSAPTSWPGPRPARSGGAARSGTSGRPPCTSGPSLGAAAPTVTERRQRPARRRGKAKARAARDAAERTKIIELPRRVAGGDQD